MLASACIICSFWKKTTSLASLASLASLIGTNPADQWWTASHPLVESFLRATTSSNPLLVSSLGPERLNPQQLEMMESIKLHLLRRAAGEQAGKIAGEALVLEGAAKPSWKELCDPLG